MRLDEILDSMEPGFKFVTVDERFCRKVSKEIEPKPPVRLLADLKES